MHRVIRTITDANQWLELQRGHDRTHLTTVLLTCNKMHQQILPVLNDPTYQILNNWVLKNIFTPKLCNDCLFIWLEPTPSWGRSSMTVFTWLICCVACFQCCFFVWPHFKLLVSLQMDVTYSLSDAEFFQLQDADLQSVFEILVFELHGPSVCGHILRMCCRAVGACVMKQGRNMWHKLIWVYVTQVWLFNI